MFTASTFQTRPRGGGGMAQSRESRKSGKGAHPIQRLRFNLLDAARLCRRHFEERTKALALDLMQCRALVTLAQHENLTQQRLAELMTIDPAALGRMLDRLEAQGWTERHPHEQKDSPPGAETGARIRSTVTPRIDFTNDSMAPLRDLRICSYALGEGIR
jgi:hypothetical protein